MIDKVPNPDLPINVNEVMNDQLLKLPPPRVSVSRTGIASTCMDQMILLKKMDRKRLKENLIDDKVFQTHQCEHCDALISFP